jgi:hypothetical protein
MASWDDVCRIAARLPGAQASTTYRRPCFNVDGRSFVNQRPLSQRDLQQIAARGIAPPDGELVLVRVEHELAKQALISNEEACFSIPHLDGYPAVLVELDRVTPELLEELITESFLVCGGSL